jgi:hypothetical protein
MKINDQDMNHHTIYCWRNDDDQIGSICIHNRRPTQRERWQSISNYVFEFERDTYHVLHEYVFAGGTLKPSKVMFFEIKELAGMHHNYNPNWRYIWLRSFADDDTTRTGLEGDENENFAPLSDVEYIPF